MTNGKFSFPPASNAQKNSYSDRPSTSEDDADNSDANDSKNRENIRSESKKDLMHSIFTLCIKVGICIVLAVLVVRAWHLISGEYLSWLSEQEIGDIDKYGAGGLAVIISKFMTTAVKSM